MMVCMSAGVDCIAAAVAAAEMSAVLVLVHLLSVASSALLSKVRRMYLWRQIREMMTI